MLSLLRRGFFASFDGGGGDFANDTNIRPSKLLRILIHSSFPTFRHNLIDTMTLFDVIMTSYC